MEGPGRVVFPCERWLPEGKSFGTVVCVHGLSGAATDFVTLARSSPSRSGLFALNLRGQGSDPHRPRRGAALDLEDISRDISSFCRRHALHYREAPLWVCGESMGALDSRLDAGRQAFRTAGGGAIFSVPVVDLMKPTPWIVRQVVRTIATCCARPALLSCLVHIRKAGTLEGDAR